MPGLTAMALSGVVYHHGESAERRCVESIGTVAWRVIATCVNIARITLGHWEYRSRVTQPVRDQIPNPWTCPLG